MQIIARLFRLIHINIVLLKHGLDSFVWAMPFFRPISFLKILFPWRWFSKNDQPTGESIRLALEELGPIFVKFGQMLSTRRDILPDDIAEELAKLQSSVPPFDGKIAQLMIEKELGKPIDQLFATFDVNPLASGSIAQVHTATLFEGPEVVIKVLRPNIHKKIANDIKLFELFAKILDKTVPKAKPFKPVEAVAEFKETLFNELDLMREAANASQLRRNFQESDLLYVPEIFWDYTTTHIMVMERIFGVPVSDIKTLRENNVNLKLLAEKGVEIFFTQVFRDCFFHADMHPGNIFVDISNPENPKYIGIDFGIMGTLNPEDQSYLADNLLSFFKRDYKRVAELHIHSGWVPPYVKVDKFEAAIRTVCEPIFEKPLKDISFAKTLMRLFQTAKAYHMEVQPQLLLLQKTLLSVEGLGRHLYPELDLWHTAKPFMEGWMRKRLGPKAFYHQMMSKLPIWLNRAPELPDAIMDIAKFVHQQAHAIEHIPTKQHQAPIEQLIKRQKTGRSMLTKSIAATMIIGASILVIYGIPGPVSPELQKIASITLGVLGATLLI